MGRCGGGEPGAQRLSEAADDAHVRPRAPLWPVPGAESGAS